MFGASEFSTITRSYLFFVPLRHCPPTSGVFATFFTGWPDQRIGPTIVSRLVAAIASRRAPALLRSEVRLSASAATSNSACANPIGCVHCFFASVSNALASSAALCPVSDDLNGCLGDHQ